MGRPTKYTSSSSAGRTDGSSEAPLMSSSSSSSNLASRVGYSLITSWLQAPASLRSLLQHHLLLQQHQSLRGAADAAANSLPWLLAAASASSPPDVSLSPDSTVKESTAAEQLPASGSGVDSGPGIVKRECGNTAWDLCQRTATAAAAAAAGAAASSAAALKVCHIVPSRGAIVSASTSR